MSSVGRLTQSPAKNDWATIWDQKYDFVYGISQISGRKKKPAEQVIVTTNKLLPYLLE